MAHRTTFAGLAAPDPGESTAVLNGDFIYHNPDLIDQFLRIGAVSHRHDGHIALVNPQAPVHLQAVSSAGFLAAGEDYFVTYTAFDARGGETIAAPLADITMPGGINPPSFAPSGGVSHAAGILPAGNFAYALTYTDGQGGETTLGPTSWIYVNPGFASSQISFTGFAAQLQASGGAAVTWRLWRSYEGEDWHLVTEGQTDTFTDSGFDPPDNPAAPPDANTTATTGNGILVTLPAASAEPALASASSIDIYLSTDGAMLSPCLYTSLPIACAGATFLITNDVVSDGAPPPVSLSIPGAPQIFPDTDMLWALKSPVASEGDLPASGSRGDVRLVEDSDALFGFTPSGWVNVSGGGTWKTPVANASALPIDPANRPGDARVTLSSMQIWLWEPGAGLEQSFIPAASAAPSAISAGDSGVTCLTSDDTYLYWTWSTGPAHGEWGAIGRSKLDGTQVNPFFVFMGSASGIVNPAGIAVDNGHIYWVDDGPGTIGRANIDGSSPTLSFASVGALFGVAVDNNYLYYAAPAQTVPPGLTFDGIYRVNKSDGSNPTKLHQLSTPTNPRDLKVDSQHIYWADLTFASIGRCNLDGSGAEDGWVVVGDFAAGVDPNQIVLVGEHLYFGRGFPATPNGVFGSIGRVKLDGTGLEMDFLDVPPHNHGQWLFGLTYSAGDFYLSLAGIDYAPSAAQTAAIERYHLGDWVLANTAGGGGSAAASGATGPQGPAGPQGPQGPAGTGTGAGAVFVQASGGAVLAPSDVEFVASAGPTVSVSSLGGSAGSATVTVPWLGVDIGASGAAGWSSAVASETFPPGVPGDFTEQDDAMVVTGGKLVDSAPSPAAQIGEEWSSVGKFNDGYKLRLSYTGLTPSNWYMLGAVYNYSAFNTGLTFAVYNTGAWEWNTSPHAAQNDSVPPNAGAIPVNVTDLWIELWRIGNTAYAAVYSSDPGIGASPIFTTSLDVTSGTYNGFHAGQPGFFGAVGFGWTNNSIGIKRLDVFPRQMLLPFRREVDFAGSGGVSVSVTDTGGGSALVLIGSPSATTGPQGPQGAQGVQGAQGPSGTTSFVASAGSASATIGPFLGFAGSGGTSVELVPQGNGSAVVLISASGTAGPQGPQGAQGAQGPTGPSGTGSGGSFVASAGDASATIGPFLGFAGSGGAIVELIQQGPSAVVLISASGLQGPQGPQGAQGPAGTSGSGGAGAGYWTASSQTIGAEVQMTASGSAGVRTAVTDNGGGSGTVWIGMPARDMVSVTTPFLASGVSTAGASAGASAGVSWPLGRTLLLLQLQTDQPSRVRLYTSSSKRDADVTRPVGQDPPPNAGLLLEVVTDASDLVYDLSPMVTIASTEGSSLGVTASQPTIACAVQNLGSVSAAFNIHFVRYLLED